MNNKVSLDKRIMAAFGVFLFVSPNLNILESILTYCGIDNHDYVRAISIGIFCIIDIALAFLFMRYKPGIKAYVFLVVFNIIYFTPLALTWNTKIVAQYWLFVLPITIFSVLLSEDDDVKSFFFKFFTYLARVITIVAIIFVVLLYVGKTRSETGLIIIKNMSYGDMAYLFLSGFLVSVVDSIKRKSIVSAISIIILSISIFFAGNRSAILCMLFALFLCFVLMLLTKASKTTKLLTLIITIAIIIAMVIGLFVIPSGSRFHTKKIDFLSPDFSLVDLLYETKKTDKKTLKVIYSPDNEERTLYSIYTEEIVKNDMKQHETERMLRDDVKNNKNEYITLLNESDRKKAEKYRVSKNRDFLWWAAIQEFKKHPVIGNGPCYFRNKYDGFYPHNILLEAMTDYGLIGLIILLSLGVYCIINGIKNCIVDNNDNNFRLVILLFSHIPWFLFYTTLYSNTILAMTIIVFTTINRMASNNEKTPIIGSGEDSSINTIS